LSGEDESAQLYAQSVSSIEIDNDIITNKILLTYYSRHGSEAEFDFALQGFLRSANRLDQDFRFLMILGDVLRTRNRLLQALEIFDKTLALDPHNERTLYKPGLAALKGHDYVLDRDFLQTRLNLHETCKRAELLLGNIALEGDHPEQAFEWYRQYDRFDVSLPLMAKIRFEHDRLIDARNLIEQALSLDPNEVRTLSIAADTALGGEQYAHLPGTRPFDRTKYRAPSGAGSSLLGAAGQPLRHRTIPKSASRGSSKHKSNNWIGESRCKVRMWLQSVNYMTL